MRPVLVAGDANVDLVLRGDVVPRFGQAEQLLDSGELVLGGSASIVACGLARLGVPTHLVARVGDDAFGRFQLDALAAAVVSTTHVAVDPDLPTGLSVILSAPDDRAILTVPGTIPTLRAAAVRAALAATGATHLHVASYFLQPVLAAELPVLLAEVRAAGVTVSLDTNWDPAARWAGVLELLPHVDVFLPNLSELRALGSGADVDIARQLAQRGPRVVVKAGADGGWSVDSAGSLAHAPGLPVDVVDTTGAGDSFDAGYLAALAHGVADEAERLRWAAAAGSLSTLGSGGTGRQATLADLGAA
ncbi:carbohydrate kinase family protein [Cellulomonas sp.]|uniref:carbohydrate kinase family protein n=1 Tax=Cellulomonas sp. TaxID=40001 RepID=UPI003BAC7B86